MKRRRILLCALCSVLLLFSMATLTVHAHPGRLDSNGGHNDYINGGYHYHTGVSEDFYYHSSDQEIATAHHEIIAVFIGTPLIVLLFYFLIKLRDFPKSRTSSTESDVTESSNTSPPGQDSSQPQPVSSHDSETSQFYSTSSSPESPPSAEFKVCHTIWLCTYHISRHCGFSHRAFSQGHIWATLLYITAKHIRDQAVVDQIYSYFESASHDVGEDDPYLPSILSLVRHGYTQFAPILNASGIDPRAPEGIQALWELIKKEDFKYTAPHPSAEQAYFDYTQILISSLTTYHKADK